MCDEAAGYLDDRLPALLQVIQESDIQDLEIEEGDVRVRLRRRPGAGGPQSAEPVQTDAAQEPIERTPSFITSPLVGTFYRAGTPGMAALVSEESQVDDGTIVGIVEALNVLTEIEAGCRGMIDEVRATDGQPVEYGQILFRVRPGE